MVSLVCCNLKTTNIYIFNFNQNQSFIKKPFIFSNFNAIELAEKRACECPSLR